MNKKILIPAVSGVTIAIILLGILSPTEQKPITTQPTLSTPIPESIPTRNQIPVDIPMINQTANGTAQIPILPIILSYDSNSILKSQLASKGISMSTPLKISGGAIAKYCIFYSNAEKQNSIQYCTSTELKDSEGKFLGNIHMFGSTDSTDAVLGVVQTDPYMSNLDSLKTTYEIMVESLVCDCWEDQKPGNLESVSAWIDAAKSHHLEAKGTTSISNLSGIAQKQLILEVTTNTEGYLWKFIISN